ncbi:MAG: transcription-repair coupling factor [Tannerellaceae bacterium]|nr:transcription-repair coupling factor [Tannerellaceae bacterium]
MNIQDLLRLYDTHPLITSLEKHLRDCIACTAIKGLVGSSAPIVIATLHLRGESFLCLLNDAEEAGYFYHDLTQLLPVSSPVYFFPSAYRRSIKYGHKDPVDEILRTETLDKLRNRTVDSPFIIVTFPEALAECVVSQTSLGEHTLKVHVGESLDSTFVADMLTEYGFENTDYVYEPGQFAVRGSILDVFSYSHENPYRIDFFDNEVETIRTFDVETQLSKEYPTEISIIPKADVIGLARESLFHALPPQSIITIKNLIFCRERVDAVWNETPASSDEESFSGQEEMRSFLLPASILFQSLPNFRQLHFGSSIPKKTDAVFTFSTTPQPAFHKNFDLINESFASLIKQGYTLYLLSDAEKQIERLRNLLHNIPFSAIGKTIHEGFIDDDLHAIFFTDHQLFDRFHKFNLKNDKARNGKVMLSLQDLNRFSFGDYIVHTDHGIGQFGGLIRLETNGKIQEVIKLIYRNNDAIFVSIHSLHKLSKYHGKEDSLPTLSQLGTGAWERVKERTKNKVKDIARDLLLLYSKRRQEQGFSFSPDTYLQYELEAGFLYEDTPDQSRATAEVKADMENPRPMDRLICGDVGFGKTEVAVRAAFKAVADNKQVAILVPTTLLAFQHYRTFTERLRDFPCQIDYLSRARTPTQTRAILASLKNGKIDILIGTHRLVSKDVVFKDLGLLIIDEEQKFGVSVKETLRKMRTNVDTLTMTATPIPRTLQFSLMGARDLSNITTPPPNRYPVQTEVHTFDADLIREAINFEMSRNGQVFFINNHISHIPDMEATVRREVPDARIAVAHGQIDPKRMEELILDFVNQEYDVLIATGIIENGIDVPNANTILINNAHMFGLSDLHQLRGRVGRSNRKAFCYLLAPPLSSLTHEARQRLQAIENFAGLGSGIHLAMQDLDIRGAGNLLGAEQSGFIADLGYETYQKILQEAVNELRIEEFASLSSDTLDTDTLFVHETFVESDLELLFPPFYIPNDSERIALYRELDNMEKECDIFAFTERLQDRFGKIPPEGLELIRIVRLRRIAKQLGMEKVILKNTCMTTHLVSNPESLYYQSNSFDKILAFVQQHPKRCSLREQSTRRSLTVRDVPSVETAVTLLQEIVSA